MTKKNPDKKIINVLIDSKIKDEFFIKCIENQTTMADVIRDLIRKYIKEN